MTRRILVITVGETPQVVTETVWALLQRPWPPDRIFLATTSRGADLFSEGGGPRRLAPLLGAEGKLRAMYQALGLPDRHVEPVASVARLASGPPVSDIRSAPEVSAFADTLLGLVRAATAEPDAELHLSLAGGRKTMSYLAGAVMSIYGRARDVLSHVLVNPAELEIAPDFWWPNQSDAVFVRGRDGEERRLDVESARVELHEAPYVRLRAYLPEGEIFHGDLSFDAAVQRANEALSIDRLVLDLGDLVLLVGRYKMPLEAKQMAVMAMIARGALEGRRITVHGEGEAERKLGYDGDAAAFLAGWSKGLAALQNRQRLRDDPAAFEGALARVRGAGHFPAGFNQDVSVPLSNVRRALRTTFPLELAQRVIRPYPAYATGFADIVFQGPPPVLQAFGLADGAPPAPDKLGPPLAAAPSA